MTPTLNLGGVLYLFLRGMVGPEAPRLDGAPCGVFAWPTPPALVTALSDLLDTGSPPDGRRWRAWPGPRPDRRPDVASGHRRDLAAFNRAGVLVRRRRPRRHPAGPAGSRETSGWRWPPPWPSGRPRVRTRLRRPGDGPRTPPPMQMTTSISAPCRGPSLANWVGSGSPAGWWPRRGRRSRPAPPPGRDGPVSRPYWRDERAVAADAPGPSRRR